MELTNFWIDLIGILHSIGYSRSHIVLGPLMISWKVAAAGIGDVTKLRLHGTVAAIKVKQAEVGEKLELARINLLAGSGKS